MKIFDAGKYNSQFRIVAKGVFFISSAFSWIWSRLDAGQLRNHADQRDHGPSQDHLEAQRRGNGEAMAAVFRQALSGFGE